LVERDSRLQDPRSTYFKKNGRFYGESGRFLCDADEVVRVVEEDKKQFYVKIRQQIIGLESKILIKILLLLKFRQSSGHPCWRTGF
jgi:hypothetical protein